MSPETKKKELGKFQVLVELTYHVPYSVRAESQAEAERIAIDMAHDGMGLGNANVIDAEVLDSSDESNEQ